MRPTDDWRHYAYGTRELVVAADDGPDALTFDARYAVSPPGADLEPDVPLVGMSSIPLPRPA